MLACRLFGHRYRFRAEGSVMSWQCQRGCGAIESKTYRSPAAARRYAAVFDQQDRDELGHRAPLIGLLPLRIWYRIRPHPSTRAPGPDGAA